MRDIRYQAAVTSGSRLLLLRCRLRDDKEFWLLPGGGREDPESEADCVAREVREETRVEVVVGALLYEVPASPPDGTYSKWRTYHCTISSGEPSPGGGDSWADLVAVRWLELGDPNAWDEEIRNSAFLFPQLMLVREALRASEIPPRPPLHLRAYTVADWRAVCEIYDLAKPDELQGIVNRASILPLEADAGMQALFQGSNILVAESEQRIAGFGGSKGSFITWLFVHPEFRRKGVATTLVREMLAQLQRPVTLNVVASNAPARALYAGVGFEVEREFLGNFQGTPCHVASLRYA